MRDLSVDMAVWLVGLAGIGIYLAATDLWLMLPVTLLGIYLLLKIGML